MQHFPNSRDEIDKHMRSDVSRFGKGSVAGSSVWSLSNATKTRITEVSDKASQAFRPGPVSQIDALFPRQGVGFVSQENIDQQTEEEGRSNQWPTIREEEDEETDERGKTSKWPASREDSKELVPSRNTAKVPEESLDNVASDVSVASEKEKEMISVDISEPKVIEDAEKEIETTVVDLQTKTEQPESDMSESAVQTERLPEEMRDQGTSTSRVPRKSLRLRYDESKDKESEDETEDKKDGNPND